MSGWLVPPQRALQLYQHTPPPAAHGGSLTAHSVPSRACFHWHGARCRIEAAQALVSGSQPDTTTRRAARHRRAVQRRAQAQHEADEPDDDDLELIEEEPYAAEGPVLSPLARARGSLTEQERAAADQERREQAARQEEQQRQQGPQASTVFSINPPGKVYVDSPTTLHKYRQNPYGYEEEFEWMDLGPQWQVPPGVDRELEKAVTQTFEEATDPTRGGDLPTDEVASQYWMGEPPEEGWNQKRRWVKLAKTLPTPRSYNGRHPGRNRTRLQDLIIGDELEGEITSLIFFEGIQVDIGAEWDGLIAVSQGAWEHIGLQLTVRQHIKVKIHRVIMTPNCRYPVQLDLLEPVKMTQFTQPLEWWEPTYEGEAPETEREVERMDTFIPPGEVRRVVTDRGVAKAQLAIQPPSDRGVMHAAEKRLQEQLRTEALQKQRRSFQRGRPASSAVGRDEERVMRRFREAMKLPLVFAGDADSDPNERRVPEAEQD